MKMRSENAKLFIGDVPLGNCIGSIDGFEIEGHEFKVPPAEGTITFSGIFYPDDDSAWRKFKKGINSFALSPAELGPWRRWCKRSCALLRPGGRLLRKKRLQKKAQKAMEEYWGMK